MNITLFGLIWILFILICFIRLGISWMIFALLFSMIFQSDNVFVISGLGIGPQIVTSIMFIIKSYLVRPSYNVESNRGMNIDNFSLVFMANLICICISILHNEGIISFSKLVYVVLLGLYMLCFMRLRKLNCLVDKEFIDKVLRFIVIFVLCIGFIQVLVKKGVLPDIGILRTFIYNDTTSISVIYNTKSVSRMYSTFMEPSYCGAFLVAAFFYFVVNKDYKIKDTKILVLIFFGILLTMSSTAYAALFICFFICMASGTNRRGVKIVLPVLGFISLIIFVFYNDLIQTVILNKLESSSGIVRGRWNEWAINAFKSSPILGVGYKNQRASSLVYTILGELGIVGAFTYLCMLLKIVAPIFNKRKKSIYNMGAVFGVSAVIVSQIIGCPDMDFCVFWWAMYVFALTGNKVQIQKGK